MSFINENYRGVLLCALIAIPCWYLGQKFPLIGGPVFGMLAGMALSFAMKKELGVRPGITFTAKKILQYAVILLGFGLDLMVVMKTGMQSLPIIISTIVTSLVVAWILFHILKVHGKTATLIGVGSSICGGSAIAATAPVVKASEEEVAQSISVIFLFNIIAALIFPTLGSYLGCNTETGEYFGIFAGTAVNDTSSVTATAATWDALYGLGTQTLDKAVTVKLTRTLAIIPITLILAIIIARKEKNETGGFSFKKSFPMFILWFVLASLVTTVCIRFDVSAEIFLPLKELSKFFIIMAMTAIGLNTNLFKLIKTGKQPVIVGFGCWFAIITVSILVQKWMGLWA